jgi:hypothetical protein
LVLISFSIERDHFYVLPVLSRENTRFAGFIPEGAGKMFSFSKMSGLFSGLKCFRTEIVSAGAYDREGIDSKP